MVRTDAQFTNESFEPNSFEPVLFGEQIQPVHQIGLKHLKQFEMHRSTSYSLSDAWTWPRLKMSQNTSV